MASRCQCSERGGSSLPGFDEAWPPEMEFPPAAPWLASQFTRTSLARYLSSPSRTRRSDVVHASAEKGCFASRPVLGCPDPGNPGGVVGFEPPTGPGTAPVDPVEPVEPEPPTTATPPVDAADPCDLAEVLGMPLPAGCGDVLEPGDDEGDSGDSGDSGAKKDTGDTADSGGGTSPATGPAGGEGGGL